MDNSLNRAIAHLAIIKKTHTPLSLERSTKIPAIIHQTYRTRDLPEELTDNVEITRSLNPDWEHKLYDDGDIVDFIRNHYGSDMLSFYNRINTSYGAARADLFRYLLMFKVGGIYLDIKSMCNVPLNDVIAPDDEFILANWRNGKGESHEQHGMHKELTAFDRGEFQQWHIICRPGHPFLEAVITRVLRNIDAYRPWRDDIGKAGVLRLTGPIAYTLAIEPIRIQYPHRLVNNEGEIGLRYSAFPHFSHLRFFNNHYTTRLESIVRPLGMNSLLAYLYQTYRTVRQMAARLFWYPLQEKRKAMRKS
jgi:mannosyltransferase OCH1-like enzyme